MAQKITFRGKTLSVQQWASVTRIPYRTLSERYRLYTKGPQSGSTTKFKTLEDIFRPVPTCAAESTAPNRRRYRPPGVYDGLYYEDLLELQAWAKASRVEMAWVRKTMQESACGWMEIFTYLHGAAMKRRALARAAGLDEKDLPPVPKVPEYISMGKTVLQARKEYKEEYFGVRTTITSS